MMHPVIAVLLQRLRPQAPRSLQGPVPGADKFLGAMIAGLAVVAFFGWKRRSHGTAWALFGVFLTGLGLIVTEMTETHW